MKVYLLRLPVLSPHPVAATTNKEIADKFVSKGHFSDKEKSSFDYWEFELEDFSYFSGDFLKELLEAPKIIIDGPPYFEDDQECGYCSRPIGTKHTMSCRQ